MTRKWHFGTVRQWHWMSSAVCLAGMVLFAVTGITLNHAADIPAQPTIVTIEATLPDSLLASTKALTAEAMPLPPPIRQWLQQEHRLVIPSNRTGSYEEGEYYLTLAGPGKDAWLAIDTETGDLTYESSDRGWIAFLNDLHKGRDTGAVWRWFIDVFSIACIVFCITGLWLLVKQTRTRPGTWPWVGAGLVIPTVLILLFIH